MDMSSEPRLATYTKVSSGSMAIEYGMLPVRVGRTKERRAIAAERRQCVCGGIRNVNILARKGDGHRARETPLAGRRSKAIPGRGSMRRYRP